MAAGEKRVTSVSDTARALVFIGMGFLSILVGFCLTPSVDGILEGLRLQQAGGSLVDFNSFMAVGEYLGAPLVNAGILLIISMLSYILTKTPLNGPAIAAGLMVYGFAFCGKTLWNVWPLVFGVLLHARVNKKPINTAMPLAWFSAALSPLVSIMTLYVRADGSSNDTIGEVAYFTAGGLILAVVLGLIAGYLVAVFASLLPDKHNGLTLYNAGMAAGLTGFLIFSVMKVLGYGHTGLGPFHEYDAINDKALLSGIVVLLLYLALAGLVFMKRESGHAGDIVLKMHTGSAVEQFGFGATLINMAVCGAFCLVYWALTTSAAAHAPLYACLFTVVGFAANGISVRTMAPIMAGVYCACILLASVKAMLFGVPVMEAAFTYVGSKNMLIAAVFGCGLSPVVYRHGALVGFLTGMVHSVLVLNTAVLHGWMNLYNNGFCSGLVATFFVPAILILLKRNEKS